jgi:hypothetical protein
MGLTNFPHGILATPNIGGGSTFAGWWSNQMLFVDNEGGGAAGTMDSPYQYVDTAIAAASAWATIYVRPRTPDIVGGDPQVIIPTSLTANLSIAKTLYGLTLIGTGTGQGARCEGYATTLQGAAGVTSTPVLNILAPYVDIENFHFKKGGMTGYPLVQFYSPGFGGYIGNCKFNQGNGTAYNTAAVTINSAWYTTVAGCFFDRCSVGVGLAGATADLVGTRISTNEFVQDAANNYGDIIGFSTTGHLRTIIDGNSFGLLPSHAAPGKARYIYFSGGSDTGKVYDNFFATATSVVTADNIVLNGLVDAGGNWTNRGWFTS